MTASPALALTVQVSAWPNKIAPAARAPLTSAPWAAALVGYSIIPTSRLRIAEDAASAFSYMRPGLAMVTDWLALSALLSALESGMSFLTSATSFVKASRYAMATT